MHRGFDEHDIPMDVLWLDIEHTDSKKYFTWDPVKFPDSLAMIREIESKVVFSSFYSFVIFNY